MGGPFGIYLHWVYERSLNSSDNDIYYDPEKRCVARNVSYVESMSQKIRSFVYTAVGECFTDRNAGVDWFDKILAESVLAVDAAKAEIKERIASVEGVKSVESVSVEVDGRNMKFSYSVVLSDGTSVKDDVEWQP